MKMIKHTFQRGKTICLLVIIMAPCSGCEKPEPIPLPVDGVWKRELFRYRNYIQVENISNRTIYDIRARLNDGKSVFITKELIPGKNIEIGYSQLKINPEPGDTIYIWDNQGRIIDFHYWSKPW